MASWEPTERVWVPTTQQGWESLTFVHFAYDPAVISRLLPDPLVPDVHDGSAWVGITPFRLRASLLPTVPGPRRTYVEANVRTYVRHPDGRDAIWFLSLDINQPAVVAAMRATLSLPYRWSQMRIDDDGSEVAYQVHRRPPHRPGSLKMRVALGEPLHAPGEFETFLVGRWRAFTHRGGELLDVPVEHEPWPLVEAELTEFASDRFLSGLGLPEPWGEPHVLFSPGVDTRIGFPRR